MRMRWPSTARSRERPLSPALASLGRAVRELRVSRRLSRRRLARASELDRQVIRDVERGRHDPSFAELVALADQLGGLRILAMAFDQEDFVALTEAEWTAMSSPTAHTALRDLVTPLPH